MKIIDMSKELQALKDKYNPNYYLKPEFTKEAAKLWGASPNEHGILATEKETVVHVGQCLGEIKYAGTAKGYWLIGISAMSSNSGKGYLPSVHTTIGYGSRQDARLAGIEKLRAFFESVVQDMSSTNSEKNQANAKKIVQLLSTQKNPQLELF